MTNLFGQKVLLLRRPTKVCLVRTRVILFTFTLFHTAVTIGPGIQWREAYEFIHNYNRTLVRLLINPSFVVTNYVLDRSAVAVTRWAQLAGGFSVVDTVLFPIHTASVCLSLPPVFRVLTRFSFHPRRRPSRPIHCRYFNRQPPYRIRLFSSIPFLGPPRWRRRYLWSRHFSHIQKPPRNTTNRHSLRCFSSSWIKRRVQEIDDGVFQD
jgi:hypothetical protein